MEAPGLRLAVHQVFAEAIVGFRPLHLINRVDTISLAQLKNFVWGGTNLNARLLGWPRPIAPLSCGEPHLHSRSCDHLHKGRLSHSHTPTTAIRMGSSSRLSIVAAGLYSPRPWSMHHRFWPLTSIVPLSPPSRRRPQTVRWSGVPGRQSWYSPIRSN